MPRVFEPEESRQFFLDFLLAIATKFEPETTGPFNRSHYMSSKLEYLLRAHLLGLREQVLPLARTLAGWMGHNRHGQKATIPRNPFTPINGGRRWACASG